MTDDNVALCTGVARRYPFGFISLQMFSFPHERPGLIL